MPTSRFQRSEAVIDSSCLLCILMLNRKFPLYGLLDALSLRYSKIRIPQHVWKEVTRKGHYRRPLQRIMSKYSFFIRCSVGSDYDARLLYDRQTNPDARIDRGEAEAIIQARECGITEVLIDERRGTNIALAHNLAPRGIVGLIREWKLNDLVPQARPLLDACIQNRFWLSEKLIEDVLSETGESL